MIEDKCVDKWELSPADIKRANSTAQVRYQQSLNVPRYRNTFEAHGMYAQQLGAAGEIGFAHIMGLPLDVIQVDITAAADFIMNGLHTDIKSTDNPKYGLAVRTDSPVRQAYASMIVIYPWAYYMGWTLHDELVSRKPLPGKPIIRNGKLYHNPPYYLRSQDMLHKDKLFARQLEMIL